MSNLFDIALEPSSTYFYPPHHSSPVPAITGQVPKTPTSITISSLIHLYGKEIPSWRNPTPLSHASYNHRIFPFDTLHRSRPCCRLLRQWLPPLPHQWSWQVLSFLLLPSSFLFSQPFLLLSTLPPISIKGRCPSVPLLDGGRQIFCLHQLPPDSSIHPPLKLFH